MTQITLQIPENKISFFMELIKNFDFVKVKEVSAKEKIKENIKQGLKEVALIEQSKMKATPLKDFLDEL